LKSSNGDIVDLYLTNVDHELVLEHYELYNVEYVGGWKFRQRVGIFKDFIDKWMHIKVTSEGAIKILAKLMLNSLYGKFASNPDVTGKYPYLKENKACGFAVGDDDFKKPVYTPMGIFITSWSRYVMITTAQKCYDRFLYCDTDSNHISGTEIPEALKDNIDPNKLGYWKHEGTFKRAKFIRQKTYVEEYYVKKVDGELKSCSPSEATDLKLSVVCAGMPDAVKEKVTFENFEVGFKGSGKLLPKHVKGGIVLVDTEFTMK